MPGWSDPNRDTIAVTPSELGQPLLPSFVAFDGIDTFRIAPTSGTQAGSYTIQVTLSDGSLTTAQQFLVTVPSLSPAQQFLVSVPSLSPSPLVAALTLSLMNAGPPMFETDLLDQVVQAKSNYSFALPTISDPDDDAYLVQVNLQTAVQFATYDSSSKSFSFKPKTTNVKATPYKIVITLKD